MNELDQVKQRLGDRWSPERETVVAQRLSETLLRRRRLRQLAGGSAALAVLIILGVVGVRAVGLSARTEASAPALRFSDGSTATALDARTRLITLIDATSEVTVSLERGGARFDVKRDPKRPFRVEIGAVAVEVVGTRFLVERLEDHARVAVDEGLVRVGERSLGAGQSGLFPLAAPVVPDRAVAQAPLAQPEPVAPAPLDWRELARRGEFDKAWQRLDGGAQVRDEPNELLLATDSARLSGHPADAARYLRRLLSAHPGDPRAPLAAFTLGRVLLDELGWPRDAAEAFARAQELDPRGPLAEDALGREVEAWYRAGEGARAKAAAERYLVLYPRGPRAMAVRKHGGLE